MTRETHGSCLCGAVTYVVRGELARFFLCHCSRCRKGTGSAHAANLFAPGGELAWLTGEALVRNYRVPGARHARSFCATCGSALPGTRAESGFVVVPAGSVDGELGVRPDAHLCAASRADWDHDLAALPEFEGMPPSKGG